MRWTQRAMLKAILFFSYCLCETALEGICVVTVLWVVATLREAERFLT